MTVEALGLFDIDGTLLRRIGPVHVHALEDATRSITGEPVSMSGIVTHGMLDRDLIRLMLAARGWSEARARRAMPAIARKAEALFARRCPPLERRVCPGVRQFLYRLHRRGVVRGLVTGNLSRIGWKKMDRAGLRAHFTFGAFAEMGPTRAALVGLALREARKQGWIGPRTPVFLVGDHMNDVRAAQANGVRSIAVATGPASREQLAACGPDVLLDDLREARWNEILAV